MSNAFLNDVLAQPRAMREALSRYDRLDGVLAGIAALRHDEVLFVGMGSSHYGCLPAVLRLNAAGNPARAVSASEILHYEWGAIRPQTLLVAVSQSGESGEIVELVRRLPAGRPLIGITNDPASALGRRADLLLPMGVRPETAASTRTYQATLVLTALLADALLGRSPGETLRAFGQAADALDGFLRDAVGVQSRLGDHLGRPAALTFLGRGPSLCTAECAALFTREAAKHPAVAFESAEFRHGPFEIVDDTFGAVLFAPSGPTARLQWALARDIAALGGRAALVTDSPDPAPAGVPVFRHAPVPEGCAPAVQIAAAQLLANDTALHFGRDPGSFRQSGKVTTVQ